MKLRDPKFGYHWMWIAPIVWVALVVDNARERLRLLRKPKLSEHDKRLQYLAGIKRWRAAGHNNLGWWAVDVTGWSKRFNTEAERTEFLKVANKSSSS